MELLEQIAWGAGMSKVMLTVFTENVPALAFYSKLGYRLDETSPDFSPASGNCSPLELARSAGGGGSSRCSPELGASAPTAAGVAHSGARSASGSPAAGGGTAVSSGMAVSSGSGSAGGAGSGEGSGSGYHILSKRLPLDWRQQVQEAQGAQQQQQEAQLGEQQQQQAHVQVASAVHQAQEEQQPQDQSPQPQPQQPVPLQQAVEVVDAGAAALPGAVAASPAAVRAEEAEAEDPGSRKKQRTHDTPGAAGVGRSASCGPEQEASAEGAAQHDGAATAGHDLSRNCTPAPITARISAGAGAAAVGACTDEQEHTEQVLTGAAAPIAAQPVQDGEAAVGGMAMDGACNSDGVAAVEQVPNSGHYD
ncbi:hypothetical protein HXX76_008775 [Chlamydomonas incerta]|uniref:N-alpha-acetyltransferase 40 n=1 Tax=Chlamydomonas incerta TaxID=51695 RepID=A0A835W0U6_CHLIN|nr:hypothetical protein HXX76_008775 [Chlamydomonas incerta]|eukprot:KAG2433048.1 hypothetical protein HXX76_008775 [Chlamydomonas incerta]